MVPKSAWPFYRLPSLLLLSNPRWILFIFSKTISRSWLLSLKVLLTSNGYLLGTELERAPKVPVAIVKENHYMLQDLCEFMVKHFTAKMPGMKSFLEPPTMSIVRSLYDSPIGSSIDDLRGSTQQSLMCSGGIIAGFLHRGIISVGQKITIIPGIAHPDEPYTPLETQVVSIKRFTQSQCCASGSFVTVETKLDPSITRGNRLTGSVRLFQR